ncbi:MAG TPA: nucleotidyltransferase domain-containing protein [Ramlibacter sp.]|uniref:nucleotidyltransferase family protein n=1 Tax=Ramlibacter sp. TaxID=1917967 RepID=UPI002D7F4497|nr:nucleotidyltransferase domain-containing protein [Ramlibacter sp.]HET8748580.1 nucleotidyltransferase domain-containing protein [Ramlibacter sp.]
MHHLIEENRMEIARLCRRHHVRRLEVFGSGARGVDFDPQRSDADFLVEFEPGSEPDLGTFFGLKDDLEALLRRRVDLVQAGAVRNPYVLASINRARELVYGA